MEKSGFQKILEKIVTEKIFGPSRSRDVPPVSEAPASELVLQRGGLPSEVTLPGETSSPELCIEGRCGLRKTEKIFSANNEQGSLNRGKKSGFQKNFEKF